jgi:hypothetical protein
VAWTAAWELRVLGEVARELLAIRLRSDQADYLLSPIVHRTIYVALHNTIDYKGFRSRFSFWPTELTRCSGIRPMNTFDPYIAAERAREAYRTTIAQFEPLLDGMEAEARDTARNLIQHYLGPDHKVTNMESFFAALVQALKAAREQGQVDCSDQMGISKPR